MLRTRKVFSAIAAAALLSTSALAGVGATIYNAPTAWAQTENLTGNLDGIPSTGNLQIHKLIGPAAATESTGDVMDPVPAGVPAPGVSFNVYPVNGVNLTTQSGWQQASELDIDSFFDRSVTPVNSAANLGTANLGTAVPGTTSTEGTATFTGLPVGLYLVVEGSGQTWTDTEGVGHDLAPSEPFLVTVPMTNREGTGWLDTVHVYPKNQVLEGANKTVGADPEATGDGVNLTGSSVGELIRYDIEANIPNPGADDLRAFTMTDKLPSELGAPTALADADGNVSGLVTVSIAGQPLVAEDFSATTWDVDGTTVLQVQLTDTGLAKATAAARDAGTEPATITYSFQAEVETLPSGTLNNQAWTSVNDPAIDNGQDPENPAPGATDPGTPSNIARSIYGQIDITKTAGTDADGNTVTLPGATFELHRCTVDADGNASVVENSTPIRFGTDAEGDVTSVTTGTDGTISIDGIHLANVSDTDATTLEHVWNDDRFCLVETAAPAGYSLLPAPFLVKPLVYDATTSALVKVAADVPNIETNAGFTLPLTGGNGFWIIVGAGVILLVVAGGYYVVARNRSTSAN